MSDGGGLRLRFWGVRGSIATPEAENLGYGGNTACLEVRYRDQPSLIFDAGSGIRRLCQHLPQQDGSAPDPLRIFLTHFHWDHIQGIPFLPQLYKPDAELDFHAGCSADFLRQALEGQMTAPYFPVELSHAPAARRYAQIDPDGQGFGDLTVRPFPLQHPGGATGYRIDAPHCSVVYASDHEHGNRQYDAILSEVAHGADVLVYDAQFTPEEYEHRKGWGHSTWREATRVAQDAGVHHLYLFHHDPSHDDGTLTDIVEQARQEFPNTTGSKEGAGVTL